MQRSTRFTLLILLLAIVSACGKQAPTKPPERSTQITAAVVKTMDLPLIESATGAETALGLASNYDPTRVSGNTFYIRLSFPEHVAAQLRVGQPVQLTSFGDDSKHTGTIREIRPALNATTLSREIIISVRNAGRWRPNGSIRGEVTLGVRRKAAVVPEQAVVLRPSGNVVYVVENGVVHEQRVKTGLARDGIIEIVDGLQPGVTVAVDGAAMLSDSAKIKVREPAAGATAS
ncbi:MAG: efflux RND transporter periplasmic adaptor subunit [Gammaproteobacteria bacterium]|nr:efflux RND transporter periplasmic adaptor subunit [Gammaproteobacteria bacterium]